MKFSDVTGLGRTIDPRYRTNLAIIILFASASITVGVLDHSPWSGFRAGCAVFFAWALSRELDPDREMSAFLSLALVLPALSRSEEITSGPLFWLLLAMRLCNRTSGVRATILDTLIVGWLAFSTASWPIWAWTAIAFGLDGTLAPANRRNLILAALSAVFTARELWLHPLPTSPLATIAAAQVLSLGAVFLLFVQVLEQLRSRTDEGDMPLAPIRVAAGRLLAIGATTHFVLWTGPHGAISVLPFLAALAGTALYAGLSRAYQACIR